MRGTIKVGNVLGVPIGLTPSWFLTLMFIFAVLGLRVYPFDFPRASWVVHWLLAFVSTVFFFASIVAHELAHALVARAYGIPVKGIRLFVFGGVAQIGTDPSSPGRELVIALVGPFTSLVLGVTFFVLMWLSRSIRELEVLWQWLGIINLGLGIFNLLPGFPMDGGRVVRALLWAVSKSYHRASRWAAGLGQGVAYLLIALGVVLVLQLEVPLRGDAFSGIWLVLLGLFLNNATRQAWAQVRILEALRGHRVADVMTTDLSTVASTTTLQTIVERAGRLGPAPCLFVVDGEERVLGVMTRREFDAVPKKRWPIVTAGEAMLPTERVPVSSPTEDAATVLQRMEAEDLAQMPVVVDGRLLGVVGRDAFMRLLVREGSRIGGAPSR